MRQFSILVLILAQAVASAQPATIRDEIPEPSDYIPLQIGNVWEYERSTGGFFRLTIEYDTVITDAYYYAILRSYFTPNHDPISSWTRYIRYDTTTALVMEYSDYGELIHEGIPCEFNPSDLDNLTCLGDSGWGLYYNTSYTIGDTTFADIQVYQVNPHFGYHNYVPELGDIGGWNKWDDGFWLIYAKINGREFGSSPINLEPDPYAKGSAASALEPAFPNPAAGRATLTLVLGEASDVVIAAYDVLGRRVAVLAEGRLEAGRHSLPVGAGLAAGTYVVRADVTTDAG